MLATRSPHRPAPLGLSLVAVRAVDLQRGVLEVGGADLVDGTPILDVKPYVPFSDAPPSGGPLPFAPDWVAVEAPGGEPLRLSSVAWAPEARDALRAAWAARGGARRSLYDNVDDLALFVEQALSRDIRSAHQRKQSGVAHDTCGTPEGGSAVGVGAGVEVGAGAAVGAGVGVGAGGGVGDVDHAFQGQAGEGDGAMDHRRSSSISESASRTAILPEAAAVALAANPAAAAAVIAAAVEEMGVAAATAGAAMAATDGNGSEAGFIGTVGCEGKWQVVLDGIVIGYDMTPAGQVVIATNMAVAGLHPHGP